MEKGYLKINARTAGETLPVSGAKITVMDKSGNVLYEETANQNGESRTFALDAPDANLSLKPETAASAYSTYDVLITRSGFADKMVRGVEIVSGQTAVLNADLNLLPKGAANSPEDIYITPPAAAEPTPPQLQEGTDEPPATGRGTRVLPNVIVPDYITVHLGRPDDAAQNVRVRFSDYIKNVVSSEIYPTWPENAIIANIHAIVTFALNRVYTEWYRAKGYPFDITSSTSYDQYFVYGRDIFANISRLVDAYFDTYAKRSGYKNPFFTQYCNGTTAVCRGLSQWGTVTLAQNGYSPLGILRYYYGGEIALDSAPISDVTESYPGASLKPGSLGPSVLQMQKYLNRIRQNYPAIPAIANPDGYFGADTEAAVKAFQRTFSLTQDGIVGKATWNRISQIYVGVTNLAELDSEGEKEGAGGATPNTTLRYGSSGALVAELQHLLNFAGYYYDSIPPVIADGVFGSATQNAVLAFQRQFGLTADGIVGSKTWQKLYDVYNGANQTAPPYAPAYPGTPLKNGSKGDNVAAMQKYLNAIGNYGLSVDGIFGTATERAVRAFQQSHGLTVDGIIGPVTWNTIVASLAPPR
ncbi:hypothetical protein FACS1894211_10550 [Clostridia bacterium]|nr:hypothetical protein FACS1894211_10550 [Clostridia bacterium]